MRYNVDKLLITIAFVTITFAVLILAITPPATGYEISIYTVYPVYFWFFLITSIACGISVLVHQAFSKRPNRWWIVGLIVILFVNLVILLLPISHGYIIFGRSDSLTHIGYAKDIIFTGHFPSAGAKGENFYPILHILMTEIYHFTGINPEVLTMIIPVLFILLYMVFIYFLARQLTRSYGQILLITTFGCILLFMKQSLMLAPSIQSFCLYPLLLFLFFKSFSSKEKTLPYLVLFSLVLILIPFFHPGEVAIFLIFLFLSIEFSILIYKVINKHLIKKPIEKNLLPTGASISAALALFFIWLFWFTSFSTFGEKFGRVFNWLIFQRGTPAAFTISSRLEQANLSFYEFISLFFQMYGHIALYFIVAVIVTLFVWKRFLFSKARISSNLVIFSILFIVFILLLFFTFFNDIWVGWGRTMKYVIFCATILNGFGLYYLVHKRFKKASVLAIILILILSAIIGVFNTFDSPIIRRHNEQFTNMEIKGMDWLLPHQNESLLIDNIYYIQDKAAQARIGVQNLPSNFLSGHNLKVISPEHFNYHINNTYGESFVNNRYFIDSRVSRVLYPEVFPDYEHEWRWTPKDFQKLDNGDFSVNKVYSNCEFWVYFIYGSATDS